MKKVRYLAGVIGLAPAAAGMALPAAAHAAAGRPAENAGRSAKSVSLRPAADAAAAVPSCSGAMNGYRSDDVGIHVCTKVSPNSSYVKWTYESVYYPANRGATWRLHVSGKVTQTYNLTAGKGWHGHQFTDNRTVHYQSICVGATSTPGFPCEFIPLLQ